MMGEIVRLLFSGGKNRRLIAVLVAVPVALILGPGLQATAGAMVLAQTDFGDVEHGSNISPFSTDYVPFPGGSPTPGHYGVSQSGSYWNPPPSGDWGGYDHTTVAQGDGSFMVVDGSENSANRVLFYTTNVVAGATYTLTGYAQTVQSDDGPNVRLSFRVNETEQGTFTFSGSEHWTWYPFTFTYKATASGPVTFSLHDNTTSYFWNDFGLDDVVLSAVPIPGSLLLLGSGLVLLGKRLRGRRAV